MKNLFLINLLIVYCPANHNKLTPESQNDISKVNKFDVPIFLLIKKLKFRKHLLNIQKLKIIYL